MFAAAVILTAAVVLVPATSWNHAEAQGTSAPSLSTLKAKYKRPVDIPFPKNNAYTPARELLGRTLFFDPRLSGSNIMSCATCHNPALGWSDGLPRGLGHEMKQLGRRTPTILNLAWAELLFWDGRAANLEEQAAGPMQSPAEMNGTMNEIVDKVQRVPGYRKMFEAAYPGEGVTPATITKAIATFERTVVSAVAPFDYWIAGHENAISDSAKRGFVLFNGKANCAVCHAGWTFTDHGFHDVGLPSADIGRGKVTPSVATMQHAFKTPTLRNIDQRAPYMHDGSLTTLHQVVNFYQEGGVTRPSKSKLIKPLTLSATDKADLVAFLQTLTSSDPLPAIPVLPRQ
jgi:cytochrome c peroxidase